MFSLFKFKKKKGSKIQYQTFPMETAFAASLYYSQYQVKEHMQ